MSPEAQWIALLEWDGWKQLERTTETCAIPVDTHRENKTWIRDYYGQIAHWVPRYLTDLNSVHEIEQRLSEEQRDAYANAIINPTNGPRWRFNSIHANAAQRCGALLLVVGKAK